MKERGNTLHLSAPDSRLRTEGFYEAMARRPEVRIVEAMGDWMPRSSIAAIRAALTANRIYAQSLRTATGWRLMRCWWLRNLDAPDKY